MIRLPPVTAKANAQVTADQAAVDPGVADRVALIETADAFALAAASIEASLAGYGQCSADILADVQLELGQLEQLWAKLNQRLIQIAVFGLVSRGKSAVLNGLYGQMVFPTGALNGVTQWPRSMRWAWPNPSQPSVQIELTDTPGLDEVAGAVRGQMAQAIADSADLILFISAGPLSSAESTALVELIFQNKPLLWVLNKQDLYPDLTPDQLLQELYRAAPEVSGRLSLAQLIPAAAMPAPRQVRLEWPDGRSSYQWEAPPSQLGELQARLASFCQTEAGLVAATHALLAAQALEQKIAAHISQRLQAQVNRQWWPYTLAKLLIIGSALLPNAIMGHSIIGPNSLGALGSLGVIPLIDLLLIRALQKSSGFPLHPWVATRLVRPLLQRSLGLVVASLLGLWLVGNPLEIGEGNSTVAGMAVLTLLAGLGGAASLSSYTLAHTCQDLLLQGVAWQAHSPRICLPRLWQQLQPGMLLEMLLPQLQRRLQSPPVLRN